MNLKMKILILVMAIFEVSCTSSNNKIKNDINLEDKVQKEVKNTNISQNIKNTSWKLIEMAGRNIENDDTVNITLNFTENRISGNSAVNDYFSGYEINGKNIKILGIALTRMGGPEELMKIEREYLELLKSVRTIEIVDSKLVLKGDNGNLVFKKL